MNENPYKSMAPGRRFYLARKIMNRRQEDVARFLGISLNTLSHIENGDAYLSQKSKDKLIIVGWRPEFIDYAIEPIFAVDGEKTAALIDYYTKEKDKPTG